MLKLPDELIGTQPHIKESTCGRVRRPSEKVQTMLGGTIYYLSVVY